MHINTCSVRERHDELVAIHDEAIGMLMRPMYGDRYQADASCSTTSRSYGGHRAPL
jgi:hypothetical protein